MRSKPAVKTNLKTREHELSSQIVWTFVIMIRNTEEIISTWVPNNLLENGSTKEEKCRRRVLADACRFDAEICLMAPTTHWAIVDL